MNTKPSRRAAWQRRLLVAALLPIFGGCVAATQRTQHSASSLAWTRSAPTDAPDSAAAPFSAADTLSREQLIQQVLTRNPTVETARQAWGEALARYPQVTAFSDPTLSYETAPGTIGSEHGYGQVVRVSQRLEWPGKQALRGAIALAEAEARSADLERVRLHLCLTASVLFDDFFVVRRALEINGEHRVLVTRLRQSAEAQYAAGRGSQQDPIQADVELALLERERLTLAAREQIIVAQINGLLHRPAEGQLPAAPATLEPAAAPSRSAEQWQRYAQQHRPELHTAARIVDARASSMALAQRAYYPDFSFGVAYNSMWPQLEHQFMLGFSLNIPIQLDARRGGVNEATAALARAESLQAERRSAVNVEVRQTWVRFDEALAQVAVYRDQVLPAARRQIEAAEAGYTSGRNSFSDIMSAQRQLRRLEQAYAEALADTWRRRAALNRAAGTASGQPAEGGVR